MSTPPITWTSTPDRERNQRAREVIDRMVANLERVEAAPPTAVPAVGSITRAHTNPNGQQALPTVPAVGEGNTNRAESARRQ